MALENYCGIKLENDVGYCHIFLRLFNNDTVLCPPFILYTSIITSWLWAVGRRDYISLCYRKISGFCVLFDENVKAGTREWGLFGRIDKP